MKYLTLLGLPGLFMAIASHQMTPLHMAVEGKHLGTVKYLVGQGADTNVKDDNGVSNASVLLTVDYYCCLTIVNLQALKLLKMPTLAGSVVFL